MTVTIIFKQFIRPRGSSAGARKATRTDRLSGQQYWFGLHCNKCATPNSMLQTRAYSFYQDSRLHSAQQVMLGSKCHILGVLGKSRTG
eukprot:13026507-Ditylum_brightwellii.AAC.1